MIEPARKLAAKIPDVHTTYWTSKLLSKIKSEQESEVNYRFLDYKATLLLWQIQMPRVVYRVLINI